TTSTRASCGTCFATSRSISCTPMPAWPPRRRTAPANRASTGTCTTCCSRISGRWPRRSWPSTPARSVWLDRSSSSVSRRAGTRPDPAGRHLVVFTADRVPADFGARAAQLGGAVEASLDSIGVAAVIGLSEGAAAELAGAPDVRAVEPDLATLGNEDVEADGAAADEAVSEALAPADTTASPTTARLYARQWNLRAVFAPEAWAAGHL